MALTQVSNSMLVQPVNPNILINPSFTVNQRGAVIDHATASYGPDRWGVSGINSTGGTMSQSTTVIDPATGTSKLVVKHRNATGSAHTYQRIEAVNIQGLYGKEMTLSFSFSNIGAPSLPNVRIYTWNATGDYSIIHEAVPTSLGNDRWTCTFTLSTDDGTIPEATDVGLGVTIYSNENKTDPAPDEWSLWETKLEVGSVATPFIARSYAEELVLCDRYFQQIALGTGWPLKAIRRANNNIGLVIDRIGLMRGGATYSAVKSNTDSTVPTFTLRSQGGYETFTNPSVSGLSSTSALLTKTPVTMSLVQSAFYHVEVEKSIHYFDAEL